MEVCLLSCVFYITDYQKYVDAAQLDVWKKVRVSVYTSLQFRLDLVWLYNWLVLIIFLYNSNNDKVGFILPCW